MGYHSLSLHKEPAVYKPAIGLCLWNGSHIALNYAFHCLCLDFDSNEHGYSLEKTENKAENVINGLVN